MQSAHDASDRGCRRRTGRNLPGELHQPFVAPPIAQLTRTKLLSRPLLHIQRDALHRESVSCLNTPETALRPHRTMTPDISWEPPLREHSSFRKTRIPEVDSSQCSYDPPCKAFCKNAGNTERLCVGMSSALRRAIDRFDEPQAASVFQKKRTPTKTGKRQRMGMARIAVTSTGFAVAIHRDRCIAGCWQDEFRLRHSAKYPRTCPRKAVGMAPGANGYEGSCGPGFSLQGEARFVKPPAKTKRISRRGAEHAEKDKGTRFDLRLLPFVALQTFEILSACEDFIERIGFSPSPVLAFSACSAPLREILASPLRALPPGAMPTALRGHVFSLEACDQNVSEWAWPGSLSRRHVLR